MSVTANNILKSLSDLSASSDKIAKEFVLPPLLEWVSLIKNKADSIAESESAVESESIPTLMSYIGTTSRAPRFSTVLTEIERQHLHKNAKVSIKARSSRKSSMKTPLLRRSSIKKRASVSSENSTPKLKIPTMIIKKTANVHVVSSTSSTLQPLASITPVVNGNGTPAFKLKEQGSKRKSSSDLVRSDLKKTKIFSEAQHDTQEKEESLSAQRENPIVKAKQNKGKNSSLLPYKSSVGSTNISVLKENQTLRTKLETKQDTANKNRKNILIQRQQKLEQNKKMREEKMEKTLQQRLRLEKEKQERGQQKEVKLLRSVRGEKPVSTTPKKPMQKVAAHTGSKTPKNALPSKKNSVKNDEQNMKMDHTHMNKKMGYSGKTNEKKNKKKETERENLQVLNSTFAIGGEPSTSGHKDKILKEGTNTKMQTLKKNLTPHTQKKGPESYAITPARSSFVSYDISEIHSDSDDEEVETNSKPIPSWATGVRLRNALLQQHHHPIDTDELFGNVIGLPDLTLIMGISKKHYKKRTSSAVWNSSFA